MPLTLPGTHSDNQHERYRQFLASPKWLAENEDRIKEMLPELWTNLNNLEGSPILAIALKVKLLGLDWRTPDEFGEIMLRIEEAGLMQRDNGYLVRRNPARVFPR